MKVSPYTDNKLKNLELGSGFFGLEEEGPAVEVAADEVAEDLADVDDEDVSLEELVGRGDEEVEGVGDGVGEATEDEDGHTQYQRQHLPLAGEFDGGGHDESATDGQQETGPGTFRQSSSEDLRGGLDTVRLGIGNHPGRKQTAHDVTQQHDTEHGPIALTTDEAGSACIEFQTIIDHCGEAESEEYGASDTAHAQVDHTSDGDADAGEDGQREGFTKKFLHICMMINAAKVDNNFESCKDLGEVLSLKAAKAER